MNDDVELGIRSTVRNEFLVVPPVAPGRHPMVPTRPTALLELGPDGLRPVVRGPLAGRFRSVWHLNDLRGKVVVDRL